MKVKQISKTRARTNDILPQTFEGCRHLKMKSNSERKSIPEEVMITSCSNTDQHHRKYISFILWRTKCK